MNNTEDKIREYLGVKNDSDYTFIVCPFHDENTPSCKVNLKDNSGYKTGSFFCFGCGAKGDWNKLAIKLNLPVFKSKDFIDTSLKIEMPEIDEEKSLLKDLETQEIIPWLKDRSWRGYSGCTLQKIGGKLFFDKRTKEPMLALPVYTNKIYRGAVKCFMEKRKLSYINTKGGWARDYGLLGYNEAKQIIKENKYTFVILTEGPRDFLRLYCDDLPAVSILGTNNFSEKKLKLLMRLSPNLKYIITMFDTDKAGDLARKKIYKTCKSVVEVKDIKIPSKKVKGKIVKLDPDSAPQSFIDKVFGILNEKPFIL